MATAKKGIPNATVEKPTPPEEEKKKKTGAASAPKAKTAANGAKKAAAKAPAKKPAAKKTTTAGKTSTAKKPASKKPATPKKPKPAPAVEEPETVETPVAEALLPVPVPEAEKAEGQALPAVDFPEEAKAEKKSFIGRVVFLLCVIAILLTSYYIYLHRPVSYTQRVNAVTFMTCDDGRIAILVNGTERERVAGELHDCQYDARGTVCAALIGDSLYYVKNRAVTKVADNVRDFVLASGGSAVAYRDTGDNLYHAVIGKKEDPAKFLTVHDGRYCLSPNGKELAYTWQQSDTGTPRMRVYSTSGHDVYIEQDVGLYPLAIADKGKYLYYTDATGALYLQSDGKVAALSGAFLPGTLTFNDRFDEVLFREAGKTVWIKKGVRTELTPTGESADTVIDLIPNERVATRALPAGRQLVMRTFARNYYCVQGGDSAALAYLKGGKKDPGKLAEVSPVNAGSVTVTDKAVFFLLTNADGRTDLHRVAAGRIKAKPLIRDVVSYCPNVDGSRLLYTLDDHALYSARVGVFRTVSKRLCDTVDPDSLTVSADDVFYFFRADGKLCRSDNGDAPVEVADGVVDLIVDGHTVCYVVSDANGGRQAYSNYRNRRRDTKIADDLTGFAR